MSTTTIGVRLRHQPTFVFEVDETRIDELSPQELRRKLSHEADLLLAQETYSSNDWEVIDPDDDAFVADTLEL